MKITTICLAGAMAMNVLTSAAWAQQGMAGTIKMIDRVDGMIGIQQTPSGTVGAGAGGATEQYKIQDRALLDAFHAGDKVTFSATENGNAKTITKLEKQ